MIIVISEKDSGRILREYLGRELGFSMKLLRRVKFTEDGIKVNGEHVTVRYVLREGDVLEINCEDTSDDVNPYTVAAELDIDVIYEDEFLTVVNKPAGMPAHPSLGHKTDTVANALAYRYQNKPYVFRAVNRLDRDTSGVMITANTRVASYAMYKEMKCGRINKKYIAVLDGVLPDSEGEIRSYIKRKQDSIMERVECAADDPDGKIAITKYRLLGKNDKISVVEAEPVTGRTHQLRVHFAGCGCPIVGDGMYGYESPDIPRHALHSYTSSFTHPASGENMRVFAPLPEDMIKLITKHLGDDFVAELKIEELC